MAKGNKWDDHYTARARQEKWLARSVYKLQEVDRKYRIIHKKDRVLDLGCYPGSWSQYCIQKVGSAGEVVGVDLQKPEHLSAPCFRFIKSDVLLLDIHWLKTAVGYQKVILSDMAPKTTGIRPADTSQSLALAEKALEIAVSMLQKDGYFLCKVFEGEGFKAFKEKATDYFKQMRIIRPLAVRKRSREVFLLGLSFTH
jgi:23S rRNA (uridine2552-2'-O)-methyltransferase